MSEFEKKLLEALYRRTPSGRYLLVANSWPRDKSTIKLPDKDIWLPDLSYMGPENTLRCPRCHAPEVNPMTNKLFIRAYKVNNRSQCLVCAGYYDPETLEYNEANGNPKAGWFK